jgi:hypothetical protein
VNDLDPAAVMAAHDNAPLYCPICPHHYGMTNCDAYRLAAALAEAQEREQRVRAVRVYENVEYGWSYVAADDLDDALDGQTMKPSRP